MHGLAFLGSMALARGAVLLVLNIGASIVCYCGSLGLTDWYKCTIRYYNILGIVYCNTTEPASYCNMGVSNLGLVFSEYLARPVNLKRRP